MKTHESRTITRKVRPFLTLILTFATQPTLCMANLIGVWLSGGEFRATSSRTPALRSLYCQSSSGRTRRWS